MNSATSLVKNGMTVHVKQGSNGERGLPVQEHKRLRAELLRKIVVRERERQLLRKMSR
ncbi:MAG: hypothetical protein ACR2NI_05990 [Pirellulales bacterium]